MQSEHDLVSARSSMWSMLGAVAIFALMLGATAPSQATTLERIKESGHIRLGYIDNARPLTYRDASGKVTGFSASLCEKIAGRVEDALGLPELAVDWVAVDIDKREQLVQQGEIDLLCTPMTETLVRRRDLSFSVAVFPSGVRGVMRKDAAQALRAALGGKTVERPLWRGAPATRLLHKKTFAVMKGTTTELWLENNLNIFKIDADIVRVADYRSGLQSLLDQKVDVFFGDRAIVLGALEASELDQLEIFKRLLTHEPLALAMAKGDEDFRLLVDLVLSETYTDPSFGELFSQWCGEYTPQTREFFLWTAVTPE